MSLSKILNPLLSTDSTQKDRKLFQHDLKIVDLDVKHQNKTKSIFREDIQLVCNGLNRLVRFSISGYRNIRVRGLSQQELVNSYG